MSKQPNPMQAVRNYVTRLSEYCLNTSQLMVDPPAPNLGNSIDMLAAHLSAGMSLSGVLPQRLVVLISELSRDVSSVKELLPKLQAEAYNEERTAAYAQAQAIMRHVGTIIEGYESGLEDALSLAASSQTPERIPRPYTVEGKAGGHPLSPKRSSGHRSRKGRAKKTEDKK